MAGFDVETDPDLLVTRDLFDPATNVQERQKVIERRLAALLRWQRTLNALRDSLQQEFQGLSRPSNVHEWNRHNNLKAALRQIANGLRGEEGYLPEMSALRGKPGLVAVEEKIVRLSTELTRLRAHVVRWPQASTTHAYRYVGPKYVCALNGRELEPGDVVDLTEAQATGWADRFVAVDDTSSPS